MEFLSLFNIGVWKHSLADLDSKYWIDQAYNYAQKNQSVNRSNTKGYQSINKLHLTPLFSPLATKITSTLSHQFPELKLFLDALWINISPENSYNDTHNHGTHPDDISGVLYLKVSDINNKIRFCNPLNINYYESIKIQTKDIIFFSQALYHNVESNLSNEDRISIAFNFKSFH